MIEVFNLEGKAIFKDKADDDYKSCLAKVHDKNLPPNIYFLRIHTKYIRVERCVRI